MAPPPRQRERAVQQRALDTRHKIIEAAIEEFGRSGYEGASTRTIAANVGLQHTLVTYHFSSKEGLWREAISTLLARHTAAFDARLAGLRGVDDVTKLRLIHEDFIRIGATNHQFHQIVAHLASTASPQLDWLIQEYLRRSFDARAELIRSVQKAGYYVEGDPYHLEYIFIGAVTRIYMLGAEVEQIMGRSPFDPDFIEEHVRVCTALFFRDPQQEKADQGRRRPTA